MLALTLTGAMATTNVVKLVPKTSLAEVSLGQKESELAALLTASNEGMAAGGYHGGHRPHGGLNPSSASADSGAAAKCAGSRTYRMTTYKGRNESAKAVRKTQV